MANFIFLLFRSNATLQQITNSGLVHSFSIALTFETMTSQSRISSGGHSTPLFLYFYTANIK